MWTLKSHLRLAQASLDSHILSYCPLPSFQELLEVWPAVLSWRPPKQDVRKGLYLQIIGYMNGPVTRTRQLQVNAPVHPSLVVPSSPLPPKPQGDQWKIWNWSLWKHLNHIIDDFTGSHSLCKTHKEYWNVDSVFRWRFKRVDAKHKGLRTKFSLGSRTTRNSQFDKRGIVWKLVETLRRPRFEVRKGAWELSQDEDTDRKDQV